MARWATYRLPANDVDCGEIASEYAQWLLREDPSDPYRLDRDHDGLACEAGQ